MIDYVWKNWIVLFFNWNRILNGLLLVSGETLTFSGRTNDENEKEFQKIGQGNLLTTLPTWGPTFCLTFDLYINSFDGSSLNHGYAELLRLTSTDADCCGLGDRIPAIFAHKNGHLHIATQIGNTGNAVRDVSLVKSKWHQLELVQYVESGKV